MLKMCRKDIQRMTIILIMIVIISFSFLLSREKDNITENISNEIEVDSNKNIREANCLKVFIQNDINKGKKSLNLNEKNFFISETLQPWFVFENEKIQNLKVYFDDSDKDLLTNKFLSVEKIETDENIKTRFKYMIEPQEHKIRITYNLENGKLVKEEYLITLIFYDDFSQKLSESSFWGMTEEDYKDYNNWKMVNGKLLANDFKIKKLNGASSLFFIKKFNQDFFVQYDLTPKGDVINFNTYLLEENMNFIFGNGNNKNISIKSKIEKYNFEPDQTYQVRLTRIGNDYNVYINNDSKQGNYNLILSYSNINIKDNIPRSFGFAVWPKTKGIEIDNFYMANQNISEFLN